MNIGTSYQSYNKPVLNPGEDTTVKAGRKSSPATCETCRNRKYQDGSNENDVSFKSPSHITPGSEYSKVRSHESEHVANAYEKASKNNGKVLQASVTLNTSICPECGRSFISGGKTHTQIKYYNEENPYQKDLKSKHEAVLVGRKLDLSA